MSKWAAPPGCIWHNDQVGQTPGQVGPGTGRLAQFHGDGHPWGLNPNLSVEMKDNSIGEESRHSWPDYNRPGALRLTDRYTNSRGWCDIVEHDNPATRAPILQAIKELARTSVSTELWDEYEVY
jgi:hypothetical protein